MLKSLNNLILYLLFILAVVTTGCSGHLRNAKNSPVIAQTQRYIVVKAQPQDTLARLAKTYLNSEKQAWRIAAFNHIDEVTPGQRLVIPLVSPGRGGLTSQGYQTVPVLLYPRIVRDAGKGVTATAFEAQIQFLVRNGFNTITLDQFYNFIDLKDQIPPKSVVITFDSGSRWVYEIAYPILKQYGFSAAIFVPTDMIGRPGYLTWQQLKEMADHGFGIGSRGLTYRDLTRIQPGEELDGYLASLENALGVSQKTIQQHLKKPCRYFAYPHGAMNDLLIALLKKHGYRAAFTQQRGNNPFFVHNFKVRRSLIYGHFNLDRFSRNLTTFLKADLK